MAMVPVDGNSNSRTHAQILLNGPVMMDKMQRSVTSARPNAGKRVIAAPYWEG